MGLEGGTRGAERTRRCGEGEGRRGKSPALSVFIMICDATMLWHHICIIEDHRCHRRRHRVHPKIRTIMDKILSR